MLKFALFQNESRQEVSENMSEYRVKLGKSDKFGQRPCLYHILIIGRKNILIEQTVKLLMSFPLFLNVCPNLPDIRSL